MNSRTLAAVSRPCGYTALTGTGSGANASSTGSSLRLAICASIW